MRLIKEMIHSGVERSGDVYRRLAVRGIVMEGENILLLYTKRYDDYSFPGGGVEEGEDLLEALKRELQEETGAKNVKVLDEYGIFEEYRHSRYDGYDFIHMSSHFYRCSIDKELGETDLEDYEIKNGMSAKWINIHEAIKHNREIISSKNKKMGLSIEIETYVLDLIVKELL